MMSEERQAAVWQRVLAVQEPELPAPCQTRQDTGLTEAGVLELLQAERADAHTYRVLARRAKGNLRRCLLALAQAEQRHCRRLETVYYLMTGHKLCPDRPQAPCPACLGEQLRRQYEREMQGAARCRRLAEQEGPFAGIFRCLALEEERHGQLILNLLERRL